jgi:hypothetical protein
MNPYVAAQLSLRFSFLFVWHFLPALTGRVSNAQGGQVQVTAADPPSTAQGMRKA